MLKLYQPFKIYLLLFILKEIIVLIHAWFIKKQLYKMLILKACFYFSSVFTKLYIYMHNLGCMYRVTMQDRESFYSREFPVVKKLPTKQFL